MPKIKWDQTGERFYETGVSKGVLYPTTKDQATNKTIYGTGVAWNGLTNVSESPEGAEATALYADNIKYLNLLSNEEFKATVEAYTYPDEFAECNGESALAPGITAGQQKRKMFGLAYQTKIGNDEDAELGYKIHLIYGAYAAPSEKAYATVNDSPEAITFSWELSTTPVEVPGMKPTALIVIDSTKVNAEKLKVLENYLYGTDGEEGSEGTAPQLPLPQKIIELVGEAATVVTPEETSEPAEG